LVPNGLGSDLGKSPELVGKELAAATGAQNGVEFLTKETMLLFTRKLFRWDCQSIEHDAAFSRAQERTDP